MLGSLSVAALAAIGAVQAGPLAPRQASSAASSAASGAASAASSLVSSAVANATSSASSAASAASSAATGAATNASSSASMMSSSASSAASSVSSAASSGAVVSPSAPANATGNQSYPLYPCPAGYLLTYVTQNVTVPMPVQEVTAAFGNWSTSPIFPNVTNATGGSERGARHTISPAGLVNLTEELVNVTSGGRSGSMEYTWNLTGGPASAMGVSLSNYSTVLSIYDPGFESTNRTGSNTTILTFTNFCANSQAAGMTLVGALAGLELGAFQQVLAMAGSNSTAGGVGASSSMMMSSTSSRASSASSRASSGAESTSSRASSAATNATSAAASGASAATSGAASGASAATSGAASVASGASSGASAAIATATSALAAATSSA